MHNSTKRFILLLIFFLPLAIFTYINPDIFSRFFEVSHEHKFNFWFLLAIIFLPALLFTFGLAGSSFLWIIAPLYPPFIATFLLVLGATVGGIGGYFFSKFMTTQNHRNDPTFFKKIETTSVYQILKERGGFWTLLTLRLIPGFPHVIVNFSCGILRLSLKSHIWACLIGLAPKTFVYCQAIDAAIKIEGTENLYEWEIVFPLILLSLIPLSILIGKVLKKGSPPDTL